MRFLVNADARAFYPQREERAESGRWDGMGNCGLMLKKPRMGPRQTEKDPFAVRLLGFPPEEARAIVLGSLAAVDAVVLFEDAPPLRLIEAIRPDVLVKGADYTVATVVGSELVQSYGGRIVLADLLDGHSTTGTLKRLGR